MNKFIFCLLGISSFLVFNNESYYGSTTAPVTMAGGIIKANHIDEAVVKYKRKDCPVCKGKGWYMSGDNIKKIECTYCEPDQTTKIVTPKIYNKNCPNGICPTEKLNYK